ncbi:MAG: hypothetical protein CMA63_06720 [Euryarchaeota archaeon]|nr:hypothetical protein [Euryarchaeota archaeon]|tara:strand:- start:6743 stop:7441 length:699 start_codon:yes stop_codon:yes gene_type:complete
MDVESIDLAALVHDPRNPRTHDESNLSAIRSSLDEHGQVEPIVVQKSSKMIIAGNGRVEAMRELGWSFAECVVLDVDDAEARALSIRLNRTAELAGWDDDVLAQHFSELHTLSRFDLSSFGFSDSDLSEMIDSLAESVDQIEEEPSVEQPSAEADQDPLDEHKQPTDMRASAQRETRLYLSPEDDKEFQLQIRALAKDYVCVNVTDTVVEAVSREFFALEGRSLKAQKTKDK